MSINLERPSIETVVPDYDSRETTARETERVRAMFEKANDRVIAVQDSPDFEDYIDSHEIRFDDTSEDFWEAVAVIGERFAKRGDVAGEAMSPEELDAFRIAAHAPSEIFKQFRLQEDETYKQKYKTFRRTYEEVQEDKLVVSTHNTRLRDFIADHAMMVADDFIDMTQEASITALVDPRDQAEGKHIVDMTIRGIHTELGFEQKATAAGLDWKRGSVQQDLRGIDYEVDGVEIDIKSSLHAYLKEAPIEDANNIDAYYVKRDRVIYFPYDAPADYENGSFVVSKEALETKAPKVGEDVRAMKRATRRR